MRPKVVFFGLLVGVAGALASLLTGCGAALSTAVLAPLRRHPPISILQSDALVDENPAAFMAAARSLGAQVVRYNVAWSVVAPDPASRSRPAGFDPASPTSTGYFWSALDSIDRAAAAAGIRLYLTLTSPAPLWATAQGPRTASGCPLCQHWRPNPSEYGAWVQAVGRRYSGAFTPAGQATPLPRVSFWSLWNEPNYGPNLAPQAARSTLDGTRVILDESAPQYRALTDAGWRALLVSGHSPQSDTILIGETAPRGEIDPGLDNMTPPQQFVRDLYCVSSTYEPLTGASARAEGCPPAGSGAAFSAAHPALFQASGWADHPYPDGVPPGILAGNPSVAAGFADFARLGDLDQSLQRAAAAWGTHARLAIYNTEFGYFTRPPSAADNTKAVSLPTAARDLNWTEYLTWRNPDIASYDQYLLADPSARSVFFTGLEFADGAPKPQVFDAYRLALWLAPPVAGRREVWGCARPVLDVTGAARTVEIQYARDGRGFHTVATAALHPARDGCYFDSRVTFPGPGPGAVRLAYRVGAHTVLSRTQAVTR